ncbi:MAG: kua-ubiquitin conjugating enzyme hybrid localization domain protein [Leptospiraceae bacterium]|nr:kua-ubiquitin conjugating enzyme hybrid localization domain protein [Leptospiraceae bacterium]MBP9163288.1 kua-ubiquitin conjugating enzyme hybrid localization domain protein [Leptospiraceae bacterium]
MFQYKHRHLEIASIFLFVVYCIMLLVKIGEETIRLANNLGYLVIPLALAPLFVGYVGADFFSGLVHFLGDTFGTEETPVLGEPFIKPFREHHVDPKGMTKHDFVETSGNNCIVSIPFLLLVYYLIDIKSSLFAYSFYSFFCFLMIAVFITNQIHKWSHMENPGRLILFLQRNNLILSPEHHQVHHTEPFDKYYCITVGWLNPFLYKIHFFESIKTIAYKIFGDRVAIRR